MTNYDSVKNEIKSRCSIVSIIGTDVRLKRSGTGSYIGLCPFHNEKTPSFSVNEKMGFYYCFGCGEKGDVFSFLMKAKSLTFPEAIKKLADATGVCLTTERTSYKEASLKDKLLKAHSLATGFFRDCLLSSNGEKIRFYLRERGISEEAENVYSIGLSLSDNGIVDALEKNGISIDIGIKAGILSQDSHGGIYSRFANRIIFPIRNKYGDTIAFGGRVFPNKTVDGRPKYLNSSESILFKKGLLAYGSDVADFSQSCIVVVEGYMDAVTLFSCGFKNVVAFMGTATSPVVASNILKMNHKMIIAFDGDNAGKVAAKRFLLNVGLPVIKPNQYISIAVPVAGKDPADLALEGGYNAIDNLIKTSTDAVDFIADFITEKTLDTPESRAAAFQEAKEISNIIEDSYVKRAYVPYLWKKINLLLKNKFDYKSNSIKNGNKLFSGVYSIPDVKSLSEEERQYIVIAAIVAVICSPLILSKADVENDFLLLTAEIGDNSSYFSIIDCLVNEDNRKRLLEDKDFSILSDDNLFFLEKILRSNLFGWDLFNENQAIAFVKTLVEARNATAIEKNLRNNSEWNFKEYSEDDFDTRLDMLRVLSVDRDRALRKVEDFRNQAEAFHVSLKKVFNDCTDKVYTKAVKKDPVAIGLSRLSSMFSAKYDNGYSNNENSPGISFMKALFKETENRRNKGSISILLSDNVT